jgi:hypothetical protein
MKKRTESVDDIKRALGEQDERLRAAYEALDPCRRVPVPTASLERLAEQCLGTRARLGGSGALTPIESGAASRLRC